MCTMTWIREAGSYQVFFNRDELRTRKAADPPAPRRSGTTPWIGPADGDHGGSWISANALGLTLCLLNGYRGADAGAGVGGEPAVSRGLLLASLADGGSPAEVVERVSGIALGRFRSFRLVALHPALAPRYARWQDGRLEVGTLTDDDLPLVSSSFAPADVAAARRATFAALSARRREDPLSAHLEFHSSHGAAAGPRSVCMHRDDAETVSFSRVVVDADAVRFFYAPHAPHLGIPGTPAVTLQRG